MKNPYEILGVSENATDAEIKAAYRNLAKKYHPDNYADSPLADLAEEKMKEINEAYDAINDMRRNGTSSSSSSGQQGSYGTNSGYARTSYPDVRQYIMNGRLDDAMELLNGVPEGSRNAEWYFLMGHVMARKNWLGEARKYFQKACEMDPYNAEYRNTLDNLATHSTSSAYSASANDDDCGACEICTGLLCANLFCRMCSCG